MELCRITNSSGPEAQKLITLHNNIFPEYERFYQTPLWSYLIDNEKAMYFNSVFENDELAGFFIYWDLKDAYYIHFIAIYPEMRNREIGQQILNWVTSNLHKPVFLESEIPYNEITTRRLNFYKRNGFKELANDPKPLSEIRGGGHPLWFMGNEEIIELDNYLIKIKEKVYCANGE